MTNHKPGKSTVVGFVVENPGPHTLIQDSGRCGVQHLGLTSAGPMDRLTFDWANRLCGNPAGTAALEITFGGLALRAAAAARIAVCGPEVDLTLNGEPVNAWQTLDIEAGDQLQMGYVRQGLRLYLAVRGGFEVKVMFGSASTAVREGLGGIEGRALRSGDFLHLFAQAAEQSAEKSAGQSAAHIPGTGRFCLPTRLRPHYPAADNNIHTLWVIPCLHARHIPRAAKGHFFSQIFALSKDINRMGYRLEGEPVLFKPGPQLSEGITPGTIQIPADGQPIVLMRDHPTIGGYPKIGVLLSTDMNRLAQLQPDAKLRFVPITVNRARHELRLAKRLYESTCPQAVE